MWILSSDGPILKGRSIWLRPGKQYLFGRVSGEERRNYGVEHKSISRKHLVIGVGKVRGGDGSLAHARSEVTVEDQGSKLGTKVDGTVIKGGRRVLGGGGPAGGHGDGGGNDDGRGSSSYKREYVIRLGNYEHVLRITWHPVVLTFSLSGKESRGKDPLSGPRGRLEDLDIKTLGDYVTDATTHVVAAKRNTPKGLQALINGKYIVNEAFIDALVYAASPEVLDSPDSLSPLEADFHAAWPDATRFLPPPGKEPTMRPAADYMPHEDRKDVFQFYTFIFASRSQYEMLQDPVMNGKGKPLLYEVIPGETQIDEIMGFIRSVAEDKGVHDFNDTSHPGGVVVVNPSPLPKGHEEWMTSLFQEVSIRMNQRLAVQNEFLEAILAKDMSSMRRPLEDVPSTSKPPSSSAPITVNHGNAPQPPKRPQAQKEAEESQPPAKRSRVAPPRFKAFDDGFEMDSIPSYQPEPARRNSPSQESLPSRSLSASVSQAPDTQHESHARPAKRARPQLEDSDEDISSFLPATTALKRRRKEIERENQRNGVTAQNAPVSSSGIKTESPRKTRPKRKEIDVLEAAREHREQEETAAADREDASGALDGMDYDEMRHLAQVETMQLPIRREKPMAAYGENSNRWDERWNGRANFKKFRRARDAVNNESRNLNGHQFNRQNAGRVIVQLVEMKDKTYGEGSQYWDDGDNRERRRGREKKRKGNIRSQGNGEDRDDEDTFEQLDQPATKRNAGAKALVATTNKRTGTRKKKGKSRVTLFESDEDEDDDEVIDVDADVDADAAVEIKADHDSDAPSPSFTTARSALEDDDDDNAAAASVVSENVNVNADGPRSMRSRRGDSDQTREKKKQKMKTTTTVTDRRKGGRVEMSEPKLVAKKARIVNRGKNENDDDDGGGLKFRFKRRR